ncbi:MAG: hypothetical protein KA771_04005 [Spirochaetales bacterium]|nr:hypothetical protein [Spirochaetales bacterium]
MDRREKEAIITFLARKRKHKDSKEDIALLGKTKRSALIMAGLYENWYTCIETAFFRISQQFENNLQKERWHHSLLSTMTLHIQGIRIAAVSPENYNNELPGEPEV